MVVPDNQITVRANPFRVSHATRYVAAGQTLQEILAGVKIHPYASVTVQVDGIPISSDMWESYIPNPYSAVVINAVPMGGDDGEKNTGRTIGMIVVMVAAIVASYGAAAWAAAPTGLGMGAGGAAAVGAATGAAAITADFKASSMSTSFKAATRAFIRDSSTVAPAASRIPFTFACVIFPPNSCSIKAAYTYSIFFTYPNKDPNPKSSSGSSCSSPFSSSLSTFDSILECSLGTSFSLS